MTWQPIETAPHDKRILLCAGNLGEDYGSHVTVGLWTDKHAGHVPDDVKIWADWNVGLDSDDVWSAVEFDPTHWMPLPNPPQ